MKKEILEKNYDKIKILLDEIKPKEANTMFFSKKNGKCYYLDQEETVLIIHLNCIEFLGKETISIEFIKTGIHYRGSGICKKFIKDLVKYYKGNVIITDVVSENLYGIIDKHFLSEKINFSLGKEDINQNWNHYKDDYGSFLLNEII